MKDIPGFEDLYSASYDGRIYSKRRNRFLDPSLKHGYVNVRLCRHGEHFPFKVHQLIAETFIPKNPDRYNEVNHINGIKHDNRVSNLEWCTRSENIKHSFDTLQRNRAMGDRNAKHIPILNFQTGIFYSSTREAAESLGIERNIFKCAMYKHRRFGDFLYV